MERTLSWKAMGVLVGWCRVELCYFLAFKWIEVVYLGGCW